MSILILSSDLVFASRLSAAAKHAGRSSEAALSADSLLRKVEEHVYDLVVLDLTASDCHPAELIPRLKSSGHPPCAIIAFGPHVRENRLNAARDAGCDAVLTRGQFDAHMKQIVERYTVPGVATHGDATDGGAIGESNDAGTA